MRKEEIKIIEYKLKHWRARLDYLERQKFYISAIIAKLEKKLKLKKEIINRK